MIRKLHYVILFLFIPFFIQAQQVAQYTISAFNQYVYNPAYTGLASSLEANGVFRKQWLGLDGSPMTQNLNIHMPLHYLSSGVGLNIENDYIGAERNTRILLSYSYHLKLGKSTKLSIGASGGLIQKSLDGTKLLSPGGDYDENNIIHNDGFLPQTKVNGLTYEVDFGLFLKIKQLEIGISGLHLTESEVNLGDSNTIPFHFKRHFVGFASYLIDFNRTITLRPAILAKTDLTQTQINFSTFLEYNEQFLFGIGLRGLNNETIDALEFIGGVRLNKNWKIYYSYDYSLSGLRAVNSGSHELMLKYNLGKDIGKGKLPKIIHNPRLL